MASLIIKIRHKLKSAPFERLVRQGKWIRGYLSRYKVPVILLMVSGLAGAVMTLAASVASKYLIDAITGFKTALAGLYITVLLIAAFIGIAVKAAGSRYFAKVSIKIHNEMQAEIFQKILYADWEEVSKFHSGDLLNRLSVDVNNVASGILSWLPSLAIQLLTLISSLGLLLYFDPTMSLIAGGCAPISLLLSKLIMQRLRSYNSRMRQAGSEIMAFKEESLQNLQVIKCFDLAGVFSRKMRDIQDRYLDLSISYNRFSVYASSFLSIIGLVTSYAGFGWGLYRLWTGAITYGTMTLFLQLSGSISGSFSALAGLIPRAVDLLTCSGRIMDIYELKNEGCYSGLQACENAPDFSTSALSLELCGLDFSYRNGEPVIQDACMDARPGDLIAIIGPSGEGKTTLIKILLGLLRPSSGKARLYDLYGKSMEISASTRRYFSYVPQGNSLMSGSIADNLRLAKSDASDEELIKALEAACAYGFVKKLPDGIYTRVGEKGLGLSEGQAQRIAIARALLREAPILLLDEATSALDSETEARVLKGIMNYGKFRICILATHRSKLLAECACIYRIDGMKLTKLKDCREDRVVMQKKSWNENTLLALKLDL